VWNRWPSPAALIPLNEIQASRTQYVGPPGRAVRGGGESVGPSMSVMAAEALMHRKTLAAVPASAEEIGRKDHLCFGNGGRRRRRWLYVGGLN
jgi:hypothetical protein